MNDVGMAIDAYALQDPVKEHKYLHQNICIWSIHSDKWMHFDLIVLVIVQTTVVKSLPILLVS